MCCGRRSSLTGRGPAQTISGRPSPSGRFRQRRVLFQYTGATGLTAQGPITGVRYRFTGHGAVVSVDARDAPSLAAVPNLSRVAEP